MNKDTRMIAEAMHHGHPMQVIVSELYRVHTMLNQLSTAIHMNRNAETDQLLSKIRDLADMLIADGAAEDAENAQHAPDIDHDKADLNKDDALSAYELARAQAMMRAMGGAEQAEHRSAAQHAAMAIALQKVGKKK
jgi:hypothetical protein